MDFRHLECFFVLAQELHFGRAAERLHVGQSSVSESIRALETTFASRYGERITLAQLVEPETIRRYTRRATGEKFLVAPNRGA